MTEVANLVASAFGQGGAILENFDHRWLPSKQICKYEQRSKNSFSAIISSKSLVLQLSDISQQTQRKYLQYKTKTEYNQTSHLICHFCITGHFHPLISHQKRK
jgi:hypothetical protein